MSVVKGAAFGFTGALQKYRKVSLLLGFSSKINPPTSETVKHWCCCVQPYDDEDVVVVVVPQ